MTRVRIPVLATLLGLAALPTFAEGFAIDLPRLEFPAATEATRGASVPVYLPAQGGN